MTFPATAPPPRDSSLLVVADDPLTRSALSQQFESSGYLVATAGTSAEAFLSILFDGPDLVILDPGPRLPGGDLYRRLRNGRQTRGVPVLLVADPLVVEGYESKPDPIWFVAKPIKLDALEARVDHLIQTLLRTRPELPAPDRPDRRPSPPALMGPASRILLR